MKVGFVTSYARRQLLSVRSSCPLEVDRLTTEIYTVTDFISVWTKWKERLDVDGLPLAGYRKFL